MFNLWSHIWLSPRRSPTFLKVSKEYFGVNFHLSVTKAIALSIYLFFFFLRSMNCQELPNQNKMERHLIILISETRICYELVHWVIIRYIHTIFQKHTFYIQGLPDQFPKYAPSEKYAAFRILLTKCNYSHYTNTPRKQWNLKSAAKQSSRTCSCEHHISTSAADVPLFEAQFLGPFLYWEVSPRCCCLEGLHWLASLFKVIGHDLAPQFREVAQT